MAAFDLPGLTLASSLSSKDTHLPLVLVTDTEQLKQETKEVRNWLSNTEFDSKGISILRNSDGQPTHVYYKLPEYTFFTAGDLPNTLPKGLYSLDTRLVESEPSSNQSAVDCASLVNQFTVSWALASYQFKTYKTPESEPATLVLAPSADRQHVESFVSAVHLTRDLINTPANDMMPQHMSATVNALAKEFKAEFSEVSGDDLLSENFPMIHAVGRASEHAPKLLELNWGKKSHPKVTLVGKGVCFDSGGLNIKTGNFMRMMKKDMGGAAHVLGLARLIMSEKLPIRLRVLVPAVENAVAGNAFRPGDVIPTRKGLTVEIDNTDAEGRLVLCDALALADEDSPELIIDFATLTGACRVALGTELPGFFCNDESVALDLFESGQNVMDSVWRLPLHSPYQYMLKSQVADTVNSASGMGGAITAALYLQKFISDDTSWVHYDVMAWNDRPQPGRKVGGEAMGLRATYEYLRQRFS